jgi:hypothetical protein
MPEPHDRAENASNASLWWHYKYPYHREGRGAHGKSEADYRAVSTNKRLSRWLW